MLAILEPVFADIATLVGTAESEPPHLRRDAAIQGLVDLSTRRRCASLPFRRDHHIDRQIEGHPQFQAIFDRFYALLLGPDPEPAARIALTMAIAGTYRCATDPALADIEGPQLTVLLRRLFTRCVTQDQRAGAANGQPTEARRDETCCNSSGLGSFAVIS